jgi:ATP-dependent DNA ligase
VDWGDRFPAIVAAVEALAARSCTIDGEVIACDGVGSPISNCYAIADAMTL